MDDGFKYVESPRQISGVKSVCAKRCQTVEYFKAPEDVRGKGHNLIRTEGKKRSPASAYSLEYSAPR